MRKVIAWGEHGGNPDFGDWQPPSFPPATPDADASTGQPDRPALARRITRQWTCAQRRRMVRYSPAVRAAAHLALIALASYGTVSGQIQESMSVPSTALPVLGAGLSASLCAGLGGLLWLLYGWLPAIRHTTGYALFTLALAALSLLGWRGLQAAWSAPAPASLWAGAALSLALAGLILLALRLRLFWRLSWRGLPLTLAFTSLDRLDVEAPGHTRRVACQAVEFGRALGLPRTQLRELRIGALLHDIGKTGVPDEVLLKPGPLSLAERHSMERHVDHGVAWGHRLGFLPPAALCVISAHHERWDGAGYPLQLRGEEIPLSARIVTLCDVFDALTHDRVYKPAWSAEYALREIERQAGRAFDPLLVAAFIGHMRRSPQRLAESCAV